LDVGAANGAGLSIGLDIGTSGDKPHLVTGEGHNAATAS
jgi:hypothetical protein